MLGWLRSKEEEEECLNVVRKFKKVEESEWCSVAGLPVDNVGLVSWVLNDGWLRHREVIFSN